MVTINRLVAGAPGSPTNSDGGDIANSVNALISFAETADVAIASLGTGKSNTNHSHSLATTSSNGFMSSLDKVKLDSLIVSGSSDSAFLLNRSNHTGTQAISTVTGLQTALDSKQASNANLTSFSLLSGVADRTPYFTGANTLALATYTSFARTMDAAIDAAAVNTLLGVRTKADADLVADFFARATLDLNFAEGIYREFKNSYLYQVPLLEAVNCARNSAATVDRPLGVATVDSNEPRIAYSPSTGSRLGLLGEEVRTNLLLHSEAFDNAAWGKTNTTITANNIVAPDNTLTADKVVDNTVNSGHIVRQSVVFAASTKYTFSTYFKAGEITAVTVLVLDSTSNVAAWHVNLLTGTLVQGSTSLASTASILNVGNGWYRVSVSFTTTAAPLSSYIDYRTSNVWPIAGNVGATYAGTGSSGLFIWGAQLEVGPSATSYIPTTTAAMQRIADVVSKELNQYNINAGSIFIDFALLGTVPTGLFTAIVKICDAANTGNRGFALRLSENTFGAMIRSDADVASISVMVNNASLSKKALVSFDNYTKKLLLAVDGIVSEATMAGALDLSTYMTHLFVAGATGISGTATTHSKTVRRCTYVPRATSAAEAAVITR